MPVARLVGVLSVAWGTVLAAAGGPLQGKPTSAPRLCHALQGQRERGAVVLADRCYCAYWEGALVRGRGSALVRRWPQRRPVDVRCGQRVGREDHVVPWSKPKRPVWMDEATSAGWPATIDVRARRGRVLQRGCRTRVVRVATTLWAAQTCTTEALAGLSRARWHAELDVRSIKQIMPMDVLRCQTPALVRQEIWGHLLVYPLLQAAIAHAALGHGRLPRQVSLQGARQTLAALHSQWDEACPARRQGVLQIVLHAIASHPRREPARSLRAACAQASPQAVPPDDRIASASPRAVGASRMRLQKRSATLAAKSRLYIALFCNLLGLRKRHSGQGRMALS